MKTYLAIDLKSFYASVECVQRGLDPLTTNLVVADNSRSEKTICLAISPALKQFKIPGRPRLFEVNQIIKALNQQRKSQIGQKFVGSSYNSQLLQDRLDYEIDFIIAPPQMGYYIDVSSKIYAIYLNYVAPEDIHVYSIDEVFIDVTPYLKAYHQTAYGLANNIVQDIYQTTGITATVGIGSNLYLAKVAMDIVAKHQTANADGLHIATLDEASYRRQLWTHTPLTDFWRIGHGYAKKLAAHGLNTMGDIARCSLNNEDLLYDLFGINAELLIDHAWGEEPCTMADIKSYKPSYQSLGTGQVLPTAYRFEKAKIVIKEMADSLALDLLDKRLVADKVVLTVTYDIANISNPQIKQAYRGPVITDYYGRKLPKPAHGTKAIKKPSAAGSLLKDTLISLFDKIVNPLLLIKKINISLNVINEQFLINTQPEYFQLDLFGDLEANINQEQAENEALNCELKEQQTILKIKKKYGKNAILKASSLLDGATAKERNNQIGGHRK